MKLSKSAIQELEWRTREQERKINDVWVSLYNSLREKHGECLQFNCLCAPRGVIHLRHDPIETSLIEEEFIKALSLWLNEAKIIVTHRPEK